MKYSPECVEAFEAEFPDSHSGLYWNQDKNSFFWVGGEHDDSFMHRMATERMAMLEGYAANWERVRELEQALTELQQSAERAILGSHGNAFLPRQIESYNKADALARKLLEKGNE